MSEFQTLIVQRHGAVAVVQLYRPHAANGVNAAMASELRQIASKLEADDTVRAVVLTGTGKFFCAGGDIKEISTYGAEVGTRVRHLAEDAHSAISTFARMRAPLVVAVNGVAAGGGFSLAMVGDLVLAASSATFTMAYSNAGLSPDGSSTYFLPRLIGLRRTQELMFMNRCLSAAEALEWNLVHEVVSDAELGAKAMAFAASMASGALGSHAAIKKLLLDTYGNGLEAQLDLEGRLIGACAASADGREGIAAFCEKRAPTFSRGGL